MVLGCKPKAVNLQASLVHDFGCADLDVSECVQIAEEIWGVTLTPNPMEVSDYTNMIKRYPNLEAIIQEAEMRASEKG